MSPLLRLLGLQVLLAAARRFSPGTARFLLLAVVFGACLMPLVALLRGQWASGDVVLAYLFELYAVLFWTVVRVVSAPGPLLRGGTVSENGGPARAMTRSELVGMTWVVVGVLVVLTGLQTCLALSITDSAGLRAAGAGLALMAAGFFLCHGLDVAVNWFARGDRHRASDLAADPLKRLVILHIALTLGAAWTWSTRAGLEPEAARSSAWLLLVPGLILVTVRIVLELYAIVKPPRDWGLERHDRHQVGQA